LNASVFEVRTPNGGALWVVDKETTQRGFLWSEKYQVYAKRMDGTKKKKSLGGALRGRWGRCAIGRKKSPTGKAPS